MSEILKAEFESALEMMDLITTKIKNLLSNPDTDPQRLRQQYDFLQKSINTVEKHRPAKGKEDKDPVGYINAIKKISEANILLIEMEEKIPLVSTSFDENQSRGDSNQIPEVYRYSKLPELKLPTFDGNIVKYPKFIQSFKTTFDPLPISDTRRLLYLQSYVTGEAAAEIDNLQPIDSNYKIVLAALDKKYNEKDQVIAALYQKLQEIPSAKDDTTILRKTFNATENIVRALEVRGEPVVNNRFLQDIIFRKFPPMLLYYMIKPGEDPLKLCTFRKRMPDILIHRENIY